MAATPVAEVHEHVWATLDRDEAVALVAAQVPGDGEHIGFDPTLTGPGRVGLHNVELTRTS